jgi:hypothetical protein
VRGQIGKQDQWLRVQTSSGLAGYVAAWLVMDAAQQVFPPADLVVYLFDSLPIRSGPDAGLGQLGTATSNTPLVVLGSTETAKAKIGQQGQWLQVQSPDGVNGFVPAWLVHLTGQVPPPAGLSVRATGNVNLRAQPNTNPETDILAVVTPQDALTVLGDKDLTRSKIGRQDQWINVRSPDGMIGWIAAWLVAEPASAFTGTGTVPGSPQPTGPIPPGQLIVLPTPDIGVNLRATADAASMRVSGAVCGEPLTVLDADLSAARGKVGVQDQWLYVQRLLKTPLYWGLLFYNNFSIISLRVFFINVMSKNS